MRQVMRKFRLVALLVALLVAGAGCSDDDGGSNGSGDGTDGGTDGTDGDDGQDGDDGGPGGDGNETDGNETEEIPGPKGTWKGNTQVPDPVSSSQGCKASPSYQLSGGSFEVKEEDQGWHFHIDRTGYLIEFDLDDGTMESHTTQEGVIPETATVIYVCTASPNNANSPWKVCRSHPDYEGDREQC